MVRCGRELLTSSFLSFKDLSFSVRVFNCIDLISNASGGLCICSTVCLTRGFVTLTEDETLNWFCIPRPPIRIGRARRSRSASVTEESVIAGIRASVIAHSSSFGRSAISGSDPQGGNSH